MRLMDGDPHMLPADFLISPEGKVLRAYYGRDIGDHLPLAEVERLIGPPSGEVQ